MKSSWIVFALSAVSALFAAPSANALTINARTAYGFGSGTAHSGYDTGMFPILGADVTFGMSDILQLGVFVDHFTLSPKLDVLGNVGHSFYGGLVRVGLPMTGFFADGRAGVSHRESSNSAFGYGFGLGYQMELGPLSMSPRIGYSQLPVGDVGQNVLDIGLMFSISLL